ncbi:MAG: hypothetical protein ABJA02_02690 [Acidobacteriota bacterium]
MNKLLFTFVLILLALSSAAAQNDPKKMEKLTVDEIVARHLVSLGTPDAIKASTSRVMTGKGTLVSKIGTGFMLEGTTQLASTPEGELFAMIFDNSVYPYEKLGFDGRDITYGLPSGKPTLLVNFVRAQNAIMKDGLFSGALSARWPLLDLKSGPKVKLETAGTAKVGDILCYKLKYSSSRSGDLKVTLFFDAATFRHVRTEYGYTVEPSIGTSSTDVRSSSRVERYNMSEDFSEFKKAGDLVLPSVYKVIVSNEGQIESTTGANIREWTFKIDNVYFSEKLTREMFKVSS